MKLTYKLIFSIIFFLFSTAGFSQDHSDETIGFDINKVVTSLKQRNVSEQDMAREITVIRKMYTRRYLAMQPKKVNLLQKNATMQSSKTSISRSIMATTIANDVPQTEKDVLKAFYDIANKKGALDGWNFSTPVTTYNQQTRTGWYGVTVSDGHIVELDISFTAELNGAIPKQIGQLTHLQSLNISTHRSLQGKIPNEIGLLTQLKKLHIGGNNLTGTIPNEIGLLTQLNELWIFENNLSGSIPNGIENLTNLSDLKLNSNNLSGIIPPRIFQLPNIEILDISGKLLSGTIPSSIGSLSKIKYLSLNTTALTGTLPPQIGQLTKLEYLTIINTQLSGSIPAEIGNLTNLQSLSVYGTSFSGSIPSSIGKLVNLTSLTLGEQPLTGTIPSEIGNLTKLTFFSLNNTLVNGSIPAEIVQLPNLTSIQITGNPNLNGTLPPLRLPNVEMANFELNNLTGSIPILSCPNLSELYLYNNQFISIPLDIGEANLYVLNLNNNKLTGSSESISNLIQKLPNLQELYLGSNQFTGTLPVNIGNVVVLNLSYNKFTGSLPLFSNIANLGYLDLSNNQLNGPIGSEIANSFTTNLGQLQLQSNKFTFSDLTNLVQQQHILPGFEYSPQSKIGQPQSIDCLEDYTVQLSMLYDEIPNDTFQWYRGISPNGILIQGANRISLRLSDVGQFDSGYYYCIAKNPLFSRDNPGQQLILESEPIKLNVLCYPQTSGTLNITAEKFLIEKPINFSFQTTTENLYYKWTFYNLDGTISGTSTLSSATANQTYSLPGTYKIKLEVTQRQCTTLFEKTFTVLPCDPIIGNITINPCKTNAIATPSSQTIISGNSTNISLTSTTPGTTFKWVVIANGVTGALSGSGNTITQTLTNTGTVTYTVTPMLGICSGKPITIIVTVESIYKNSTKSGLFTRNNCEAGGAGTTVTYTVPANTYSSTSSQADADAKAQNDVNTNGQAYANTNGNCSYSFVNSAKSGLFTRNNCGAGGAGTTVTYTVPANTYSSTSSQADADAKAQNDVNTNGQVYANTNGNCSYSFVNSAKSGLFTRNNCGAGGAGTTVTYTVPANTYSSTSSQADADAKAQNDVNTNGQAYANTNGTCSYYYDFSSSGKSSSSLACSETSFPLRFYSASNNLAIGTQMYSDPNLTTPILSDNLWYKLGVNNFSYKIASNNRIIEIAECPPPVQLYRFKAAYGFGDLRICEIAFIDEYGQERTQELPRGPNVNSAPCVDILARTITFESGAVPCD